MNKSFISSAALVIVAALLALALPFSGLATSTTHAQEGDTIAYNVPAIVTLNPGQNTTRYFNTLTGDSFELKLSRLAEYNYTAVLVDPLQAAMPLPPGPDGSITYVVDNVATGGQYALVLQSSDAAGDMLIQLNSTAVEPVALNPGETTVTLDTTAQRFSLVPPPDVTGPTRLTVSVPDGPTDATTNLPTVQLADQTNGSMVLDLYDGTIPYVRVALRAQTTYLLAFAPGLTPQQIVVTWEVAPDSSDSSSSSSSTSSDSSSSSSSSSGSTGSSSSSDSSSSSSSYSGACRIYFNGAVNVRSGPSTAYTPPIGQAGAGSYYDVTGRNENYTWYQINYNGQAGWVSAGIPATELQGDCAGTPYATYPALSGSGGTSYTSTPIPGGPTYTPTYSYTPTYTYTPGGPTPTYTYTPQPGAPTYTYTPPPTYTYTPPTYTPTTAVQEAPPDGASNGVLNVPLDGNAAAGDYVSYPGGDTEDVVSYRVSGLNQSVAFSGGQADLTMQLTCSGNGTQYIVFRIDGQDYSCGQTFVRRVNIDSNTGAVRVYAVGGTATYVQWYVNATAPRVN